MRYISRPPQASELLNNKAYIAMKVILFYSPTKAMISVAYNENWACIDSLTNLSIT